MTKRHVLIFLQLNNNEDQRLTKDVVQMAVRAANVEGDAEHQRTLSCRSLIDVFH